MPTTVTPMIRPLPAAKRDISLALSNPRTRITGTVVSEPVRLQHQDGTHAVQLTLMQHGGVPVLAHRCFGSGAFAQYLADQAAAHAKPGADFTAEGDHLSFNPATETLEVHGCVTLAPAHRLGVLS